jgi:chromosome segregation ATPase
VKYQAMQYRVAQLEAEVAALRIENGQLTTELEPVKRERAALALEVAAMRSMDAMLTQVRTWFHEEKGRHEATQRELAALQRTHASVRNYAARVRDALQSERRKRWLDLRDQILASRLGAMNLGATEVGSSTVQQMKYASAVADRAYGPIELSQDQPSDEPGPPAQLKLFVDRGADHPHQATHRDVAA